MDLVNFPHHVESWSGSLTPLFPVPSLRPRTRAIADRDGSEGDDPPAEELQDELLVRGYTPLLGIQVDHCSTFPRY